MEGRPYPQWVFRGPAMRINPPPSSFENLLPHLDARDAGTETNQISWIPHLAASIPITRVPAWTRVPIQPHEKTGFKTLIMKRVGLYTGHPTPEATWPSGRRPKQTATFLFVQPDEEVPFPRRVRQRTDAHEKAEGDAEFMGAPLSHAEITHLYMSAKVSICNNYIKTSSGMTRADRLEYQKGTHFQVCPQKRYAIFDEPTAKIYAHGNTFDFYLSILPIVQKAHTMGKDIVDISFASVAETSSVMKGINRDPRQYLAALGVPDLSNITDVTEPESPHFSRSPLLKAEPLSPRKRKAKLTTPIKHGFQRLTQSLVKLVPVSNSKSSPSPTKSSSRPSTPVRFSTAISAAGQSSPLTRAALTAPEELSPVPRISTPTRGMESPSSHLPVSSPFHQSPDVSVPKAFRTGSYAMYDDSLSTLSSSNNQSFSGFERKSFVEQAFSPSKITRPVAPTPSRGIRVEPSTPQVFTPMPVKKSTLAGIAGLSRLAPSTPQLQSAYELQTPDHVASINFGQVTPSFTSSIPSEPQRVSFLNAARRRQSEPLQRMVFEMNARRQSGTPLKVAHHRDDTFQANTSVTNLFTPRKQPVEAQSVNDARHIDDRMSVDDNVPAIVPDTLVRDPMHVDDQPVGNTLDAEQDTQMSDDHDEGVTQDPDSHMADSSEPTPPPHGHEVVDIDMRQNPNIFGAQTSSPATGRDAVKLLAEMAENNCADQAKVQVTQFNGRLVVRFKLPTEFASLFPETQGLDDKSMFSSSPSISNSPRIRFPIDGMGSLSMTESNIDTPFAAMSSTGLSSTPTYPADDTMDFQPTANNTIARDWARPRLTSQSPNQSIWNRDRYPPNLRQQDATLVVDSNFGNTPIRAQSSMQSVWQYTGSVNATPNEGTINQTPAINAIFAPALRAINGSAFKQPELPTPTRPFGAPSVPTPSRLGEYSEMPTPSRLLEGVSGMGSSSIWSPNSFGTPAPRLSFSDMPFAQQSRVSSPLIKVEPESSNLSVLDHTPSVSGLGLVAPQAANLITPSQGGRASLSPAHPTPVIKTPEASQPVEGSSPMFGLLTRSAKPLSPLEATPKAVDAPIQGGLLKAAQTTPVVSDTGKTTSSMQQSPTTEAAQPGPTNTTPTPAMETKSMEMASAVTPSPKPSFTPVNQREPQVVVTAPSTTTSPAPTTEKDTPPVLETTGSRVQDYDSPGRAYMRDFIMRARPKRPSTTETGSPIAPVNKRLPLEAKSANSSSPQKNKRKVDAVEEAEPTSEKPPKERAPKRAKRQLKPKQKAELAIDMNDDPSAVLTEAADETANDVNGQDDAAQTDDASSTRRSTRLRSQTAGIAGAKSSIPTSIKLNRSGPNRTGGAVLNSMVRNEQQDLTNQTRMNTRKNKGSSEYPKQVLARFADSAPAVDSDETEVVATTAKSGKGVNWKDPLESVQGEKEPEKPKSAPKTASKTASKSASKTVPKATPKATLGKSGIAKPKTASKTTSQVKRTTKLAENLGMVANGTPAKPQRMTRARTRSQQS